MTDKVPPPDVIAGIAREVLRLETLETHNSDSLDFKEQSVWSIKRALEAAWLAGFEAGQASRKRKTS